MLSDCELAGLETVGLACFPSVFCQTARKTHRVFPEVCPEACAQKSRQPTIQSPLVVAFNVKGHGLNAGRPHRFAGERVRVSVFVTVYLHARGEVAERLKAAVC